MLAEADDHELTIWYADATDGYEDGVIIEIFFDDDDALLERLREAGWTVEPAPAGAYMLATPDGFVGCRVVSDGGKVEPIGREAPRSA